MPQTACHAHSKEPTLMNYLAFDTLKMLEDLEEAGIEKKQAKAISQVIRQSHEAADVATKNDLKEATRELSAEIKAVDQRLSTQIKEVDQKLSFEIAEVKRDVADLHKDMDIQFADVRKDMDAQFADVRKDMDAQFADVRKDMDAQFADVRRDMNIQFADVRKDFEIFGNKMLQKLTVILISTIGVSATIVGLVVKFV
nr:coiled-coil domain-containing protein [Candidatus Hamiltonella defensa]